MEKVDQMPITIGVANMTWKRFKVAGVFVLLLLLCAQAQAQQVKRYVFDDDTPETENRDDSWAVRSWGLNSLATFELTGNYTNAIGPFSAALNDGNSGFARSGGGMTFGASQHWIKNGGFMGGFAFEFRMNWIGTSQAALRGYVEDAYETPASLGTQPLVARKKWGLYNTLIGPSFGYMGNGVWVEGRFLIGRLRSGNPNFDITNGNYIPPEWAKFYINQDNSTRWSRRHYNFSYSPSLNIGIMVNEYWGLKFTGNYLAAKLSQEMEVIDARNTPAGITFQRRQETFTQDVRTWSAGLGIYIQLN